MLVLKAAWRQDSLRGLGTHVHKQPYARLTGWPLARSPAPTHGWQAHNKGTRLVSSNLTVIELEQPVNLAWTFTGLKWHRGQIGTDATFPVFVKIKIAPMIKKNVLWQKTEHNSFINWREAVCYFVLGRKFVKSSNKLFFNKQIQYWKWQEKKIWIGNVFLKQMLCQ